MRDISLLALCLVPLASAVASPAIAVEGNATAPFYKLVNTMLLNDSAAGNGIEMIFQADSLPEGGLRGDILNRDSEILCKTWADQVITHVLSQTKSENPKFLVVTVRHGGIVGTYVKRRFLVKEKQCLGATGS